MGIWKSVSKDNLTRLMPRKKPTHSRLADSVMVRLTNGGMALLE
jgi:hypothetical protein